VADAVRFTTWDSNIQLSFAFVVNALLLITGVAVFKSGAVKDPSFFGLFRALSDTSVMNNGILAKVARTGVLSTLFAVALLASGQNSTITGTLTGQIIMEGFIHMKMPLWMRRLVTRLLSIIPVLICVAQTASYSAVRQHEALNNLMNNSQVFLAFALPFSMLPLIMFTDSKTEMGSFKNNFLVKFFGWLSVIVLTVLNMYSLPDAIVGFYGDNPTAAQISQGHLIAYILIVLIVLLLIWTVYDLYRGNERYKKELAANERKETN
jgi:manganese transport protein